MNLAKKLFFLMTILYSGIMFSSSYTVNSIKIPVPLYTIIFYFSQDGLQSVQPVLAENTSWSKAKGMGGPFDQDLSAFLTGMSSSDWEDGLYFFMYALDYKGNFLSDLSSISSSNPAKIYVAFLDSNLILKKSVQIPDLGTIPFTSFNFNLNRTGATLNVNYAELCFFSNPSQAKAAVSREVLFSALEMNGKFASDIIVSDENLTLLALDFVFSNGDTVNLPFVSQQLSSIMQQLTNNKSVTVSYTLDDTGTHYAIVVDVKTSSGDNVTGFPLTISAANFKTDSGSSIPTSNNHVSKRAVVYKTSNMSKSISLGSRAFTLNPQVGSQTIKVVGSKKQEEPKHVVKQNPIKVKSNNAGSRF